MRKPGTILFVMIVMAGLCGAAFAADAPDGKALYESKCGMCHGKDGVAKATAKNARNLNDSAFQAENTVQAIEKVIVEGKSHKGMKDKLTPEQIAAIAAYVKTLK